MGSSNDYEEESEEAVEFKLERPVFIRPGRKDELKRDKKVKKTRKIASKVTCNVSKKASPSPLLLVQEVETAQHISARKETPKPPVSKEKYYEYGDSVSGYKFIGTKKDLLNFENTTSQSPDEIDPRSFDRLDTPKEPRFTTSDYVVRYWDQEKTMLYLPVVSTTNPEDVHIDEITTERVQEFYLRSCTQLGFEMATVLKNERLKWHPDRLVGRLPPGDAQTLAKVTRLFQIINDLWESQ